MSDIGPNYQLGNAIPPAWQFAIATSGVVTAATATATIPAIAGRTIYITGVDFYGGGSTAGGPQNLIISPTNTTNLLYPIVAPASATTPVSAAIRFPYPIPVTGPNTAAQASIPSLGTGNTAACIMLYGFYA